MQADGILFDLDGTLWDTVDVMLHMWNQVLSSHPGVRPPIDRREQESVVGMQMDELVQRLLPGQTPERQMALLREQCEAENRYLYEHGGTLYPEVEETLRFLHASHKLFVVSNCQTGYIEAFLHAHRLEPLFDGHLSFGDTGRSKGENIKTVARRHALRQPVYVGDTQGDLEAAEYADVPFIYAAYGFGNAAHWSARIEAFSDLRTLL